MICSLTRLRVRSLRYMPGFAIYTLGSLREIRRAPGFLQGRLLADRHLAFWTLTLWNDERSLRTWRGQGAHGKSMPKLKHWCDEAGVARWDVTEDASLPDWPACHRQLTQQGRLTPVLKPSAMQKAGIAAIPAPTTRPSSFHI